MVQNRLVGAGIHHEALGVRRFDGGLLNRGLGFGEKALCRDLGMGTRRGSKEESKKDEWTHWKWFGWSGRLIRKVRNSRRVGDGRGRKRLRRGSVALFFVPHERPALDVFMHVGPDQIDVARVPIVSLEPPGTEDLGPLDVKDTIL